MTHKDQQPAHVAVVGAGFTGMACALILLKAGYRVTVLEGRSQIGGLTASHNFRFFSWDRFYHCILTSDSALLGLIDEIGLTDKLRWTSTEVGLFAHGELHAMTGPRNLLRYPHLSLFSKMRLGLAAVYASRLRDGERLEKIPLEAWTRTLFGDKLFREIWEPLFRCKLGETRHRASAAFLWGTLRRLYSTRDKGPSKQERLGYVQGGYATIFETLLTSILERGAEVRTGARIEHISSTQRGAPVSTPSVEVASGGRIEHFDGVILTLPNEAIASCLGGAEPEFYARLRAPEYLGLVCVVLVLCHRLSPYYVTNIGQATPFTGIIEMTNLIDSEEETAGCHLVYLPRYMSLSDPFVNASDEEVWQSFEPELRRMHPDFSSADVLLRVTFRERVVQPVPTIDYSKIVPPIRTPVPGVYIANTAQILNNTLNNNVMTGIARATCWQLMQDLVPYTEISSPGPVLCSAAPGIEAIQIGEICRS